MFLTIFTLYTELLLISSLLYVSEKFPLPAMFHLTHILLSKRTNLNPSFLHVQTFHFSKIKLLLRKQDIHPSLKLYFVFR